MKKPLLLFVFWLCLGLKAYAADPNEAGSQNQGSSQSPNTTPPLESAGANGGEPTLELGRERLDKKLEISRMDYLAEMEPEENRHSEKMSNMGGVGLHYAILSRLEQGGVKSFKFTDEQGETHQVTDVEYDDKTGQLKSYELDGKVYSGVRPVETVARRDIFGRDIMSVEGTVPVRPPIPEIEGEPDTEVVVQKSGEPFKSTPLEIPLKKKGTVTRKLGGIFEKLKQKTPPPAADQIDQATESTDAALDSAEWGGEFAEETEELPPEETSAADADSGSSSEKDDENN